MSTVNRGDATITVHAPHDLGVLGEVEVDDTASIDAKVGAAAAAMEAWTALSPMDRARRLLDIESDTRGELDELAVALSLEQGKTVKEARVELDRYLGPFVQYAGLGTASGGVHVPLGGPVTGQVRRGPVGVVAAVVPWNFPASLFGTKLAPALAAGCGFLIKPAETTPLITMRLAEIASRHLPEGLLDVVVGGAEVGRALVSHPGVARVAFTGSTAVGREIAATAARGLKRVSIEAGGCDPFVLLEDADLRAAARALMGTRFYNAGQVCVAPKRLVVRAEVLDEVVELMAERIARIRPGHGTDPAATMGPLHTARGRDVLEAQVADAGERGATIIGGGRPTGPDTQDGWFVRPSLIVDPPTSARVRHEETFGPALTIIPVTTDDEAVWVANETEFGLGASVWSADRGRALTLAERIDAGYKWVNTLGRVYDELPFGGVKSSGMGREHGVEALESYLEPTSYVIG